MQDTNPAAHIFRESIRSATELVPAARVLYDADDLDGTLEALRDAKKAAVKEAALLRKQAAATTDNAELIEEVGDVDDAISIIGRGILALELCDSSDPTYKVKTDKAA